MYSGAPDDALAAAGERARVRCTLAQALGRLGPLSCTRYRACTCGPWYLVVYQGPYSLNGDGRRHLGGGFALRCCQRFSLPGVATGQCPGQDNPHTSGPSAPVLSYWGRRPAHLQTPTTDRDRTVSRRSEPSSRTALMGEQPNPWDRLQPQDATSRHRGAKPSRRCELLERISLLSPG